MLQGEMTYIDRDTIRRLNFESRTYLRIEISGEFDSMNGIIVNRLEFPESDGRFPSWYSFWMVGLEKEVTGDYYSERIMKPDGRHWYMVSQSIHLDTADVIRYQFIDIDRDGPLYVN